MRFSMRFIQNRPLTLANFNDILSRALLIGGGSYWLKMNLLPGGRNIIPTSSIPVVGVVLAENGVGSQDLLKIIRTDT